MSFKSTKPAFLDPLQSQPVRDNFNALASHHEGATSPANPETGWLWLDTSNPLNYRLRMYLFGSWIVILNNLLGGFPSSGGATKVVHSQPIAGGTWLVVHNLDTANVTVTCWDNSVPAQIIIPNTVTFVDNNTIQIDWGVAQAGKAIVIG